MDMSGKLLTCALAVLLAVETVCAQRIPADYSYRGMTFRGTVFLPSTVIFNDCRFVTDSVVLEHSFGAVFRNCTFECRSDVLYLAESGSGMALVDCNVSGAEEIRFSKTAAPTDRNYVTGLSLNGHQCGAADEDSETVIELDGLEMGDALRRRNPGNEILFARIVGEDGCLTLQGVEKDMFVGWCCQDSLFSVRVTSDPRTCVVEGSGSAVVSAYTEYGIEASKIVRLK